MEITKYKTLISLELHLSTDMKMEALEQSLSPLNWNLLMSGCPLFKSTNKYTRIIVGGYGFLIVISTICFTSYYVYSWKMPVVSSMFLLLLIKAWILPYMALAVSTILVIWSARLGFQRILSRISTLLSNEDRKKLHFLSLVLFIYKILFMIVFQSQYLWPLYGNLCRSWRMGWWSFLSSIFHISVQLHDWELIIFSLFITLLQAIHLAEKNLMNILGQNLEKVAPKVLYRQLHKMLSLKEYFMKCVSFLPFFLYFYIFIESVYCVVMLLAFMDNSSDSDGDRLTTILLNLRNIVTVSHSVLLTLYTDYLSCQSRSQLKKMEYQINTKHDHLLERKVMKMIEASKKYEYRVADLFVINKELLLSFFSSFVTFTVLFVQLITELV